MCKKIIQSSKQRGISFFQIVSVKRTQKHVSLKGRIFTFTLCQPETKKTFPTIAMSYHMWSETSVGGIENIPAEIWLKEVGCIRVKTWIKKKNELKWYFLPPCGVLIDVSHWWHAYWWSSKRNIISTLHCAFCSYVCLESGSIFTGFFFFCSLAFRKYT